MRTFALVFVLFLSFATHAAWQVRSGKVEKPIPFTYTIAEDLESPNTDIVYQFHGGGGSDESVAGWAEQLGEIWQKQSYPNPRFVAISFGELWMLTPKNDSPASGLLPYFLGDAKLRTPAGAGIMSMAETEWLTNKTVGERHVVGHSMGGLNGVMLAIVAPEAFTKIYMAAPAILPISPFASDQEIKEFSERNGIPLVDENGRPIVKGFLEMIQQVVPTPEAWAEVDPSVQLPLTAQRLKAQGKKAPALLISTGDKDRMYFEGSQWVANLTTHNGFPTTWVPVHGAGHNTLNWDGLARFLMREW